MSITLYPKEGTSLTQIYINIENNKLNVSDNILAYFDSGCSITTLNSDSFNVLSKVFNHINQDGVVNVSLANGKYIGPRPLYIIPRLRLDNLYLINKKVIIIDDWQAPNLIGNDIFSRLDYKVDNSKYKLEIEGILSHGVNYIKNNKNIIITNFDGITDITGHEYYLTNIQNNMLKINIGKLGDSILYITKHEDVKQEDIQEDIKFKYPDIVETAIKQPGFLIRCIVNIEDGTYKFVEVFKNEL